MAYLVKILDSTDNPYTLNSAYNKVTFNEKSAIMKENLLTKYTPFTFNEVALNKKNAYNEAKSPHIFFLSRWSWVYSSLWCAI